MVGVAVIGGGLSAISCALALAEQGIACELFEASPQLGGRTRSFYDPAIEAWVDNGPHLLIGAYAHARDFFARHGVTDLAWQPRLNLPLWHETRGHFALSPSRALPLPAALAWAAGRLPGHGFATMGAMVRLGMAMRRPMPEKMTADDWLESMHIPTPLKRDLLEPLCLGAMNEPIASAPASSFAHVLREGFANHDAARLGWFTRPFAQALIAPLEHALAHHGVRIHRHRRVVALDAHAHAADIGLRNGRKHRFDRVVLALPAHARNRLLGIDAPPVQTRAISNVHLWFDEDLRLPQALVGGIGTTGQWYFDIGQQMPGERQTPGHFCAVISDSTPAALDACEPRCERLLADELSRMLGVTTALRPRHVRIVHERRATVLARPSAPASLPASVLDAGECPRPGELPATIETAVMRGQRAAQTILSTPT